MFDNAPYTPISATSHCPLFVFCDHASHYIPAALDNLGLSDTDLQRHIAWDIGAKALSQHICKTFGATGLMAGFSRLVIDPNRAPDSPGLIPKISDQTPIPGNQNLSPAQKQARMNDLYEPYHQALGHNLDQLAAQHTDPLIVSIHSFTPQLADGSLRELDFGLLWKVDKTLCEQMKTEIERIHPYTVGLNEPYSALHLNHTMDRHVIPRGLRHITFEIRQDLIDTEAKISRIADHISHALKLFIKD